MAFSNFGGGTGNNPVNARKNFQRQAAQAVVSGKGSAAADPNAPSPSGADGGSDDGSKVTADDPSANYMGPESGPFKCQNCEYFVADGQPCQKVSDPVAAEGCCNKFSPNGGQDAAQGQEKATGVLPNVQQNQNILG